MESINYFKLGVKAIKNIITKNPATIIFLVIIIFINQNFIGDYSIKSYLVSFILAGIIPFILCRVKIFKDESLDKAGLFNMWFIYTLIALVSIFIVQKALILAQDKAIINMPSYYKNTIEYIFVVLSSTINTIIKDVAILISVYTVNFRLFNTYLTNKPTTFKESFDSFDISLIAIIILFISFECIALILDIFSVSNIYISIAQILFMVSIAVTAKVSAEIDLEVEDSNLNIDNKPIIHI